MWSDLPTHQLTYVTDWVPLPLGPGRGLPTRGGTGPSHTMRCHTFETHVRDLRFELTSAGCRPTIPGRCSLGALHAIPLAPLGRRAKQRGDQSLPVSIADAIPVLVSGLLRIAHILWPHLCRRQREGGCVSSGLRSWPIVPVGPSHLLRPKGSQTKTLRTVLLPRYHRGMVGNRPPRMP